MFYNFRKNKKAFTLVELIVVIAIIGILGAVVGVAVSSFVDKGRQTAATSPLSDFADMWQNNVNDPKPQTLSKFLKAMFPTAYSNFWISAKAQWGNKPSALTDFTLYYHDANCGDYYGQIKYSASTKSFDKSDSSLTYLEAKPTTNFNEYEEK